MARHTPTRISLNYYYQIIRIDAASEGQGYKQQLINAAKRYLVATFPHLNLEIEAFQQQERTVQNQLIDELSSQVTTENKLIEVLGKSSEGTCLRCYVSHFIWRACRDRFHRFSNRGQLFQLDELLPLVLTDDGKFVSKSGNNNNFIPYSFTIIQEYLQRTSGNKKGLERWAFLRTKQSDLIEKFLLERGICTDSDWAILNATETSKLEQIFREFHHFSSSEIQHLSDSEIQQAITLLDSYHQVYRSDRRQSHQYGACSPPTPSQQQRMLECLPEKYQLRFTSSKLLKELTAIAKRLRDYRLYRQNSNWRYQSLDAVNPETGKDLYEQIADPQSLGNIEQIQEQAQWEELQLFLPEQLIDCLDRGIEQGFKDVISSLSSKSAHLTTSIKPALRLLLCEGLSQSKTASLLHLTQSQVSRHIKPLASRLFAQVKLRVQEKLLERILNKIKGWGLVENDEQLAYFDNLVIQLEVFFTEKVFPPTEAQMGDVRTRQMDSLYFQRLNLYLAQDKEMQYD